MVHYMYMKRIALVAMASSLALAGCATPAYVSPVEVTRFVGDQSAYLGQGTIEIVAAPGTDTASIEFGIYADAVRHELETLGYRVVAQDAQQVAAIAIESFVGETERGRGPVSVGAGGSTGSYGSGVGVGIGIDLGSLSGPPPERIEREIFVAIRSEDQFTNLWEGRASMVATSNSDYAAEAAAATRMATALFTDFPGNSGETIEVE